MFFSKGDKIEVTRDDNSYFPATVLRHSSAAADSVHVRYDSLFRPSGGEGERNKRLRERVETTRVRPAVPVELHRCFREGEAVDALCGDGAWRVGRVAEILEGSRYAVETVTMREKEERERERVEVEQWELRVHRDWDDGSWVPPLIPNQVISSEPAEEPRKLKLKIKFSGRPLEPKLCTGAIVEVKHDKEGCQGAWFNAVIVDSIGDDKVIVEYQSHESDTKSEIFKEIVDSSYVRPCPPEIARLDRYMQFEEVDAFWNDGWWIGHISKVLSDDMYTVRLGGKNDVLIVDHSKLRIHQDWIDGKWVASSLSQDEETTRMETENGCYEREPKRVLNLRGCNVKSKRNSIEGILDTEFSKGTVVEVKSHEEGYHGSWYTAVIVGSLVNDKYTVEYQTLKTDDESKLLEEEADVVHIRPCPPEIQRLDRFRLFERVDVWYNDGWWVGIITRILEDLNYTVYFWTTNEELQCEHFTLRPHQEWLNGKFVADFMKPPAQLPPKPKPGKSKRENGFTPVEEKLYKMGKKVEVRSDEEEYSGTWYPAVVLGSKGSGKFLVEYKTLKVDDKMELLKEVVDSSYMRPSPSVTQCADPFKPFEEVEAWYNNAWWHCSVCVAFTGSKYEVRIKSTDEVVEFQHSELRRYKYWAGGKWTSPPEVFS